MIVKDSAAMGKGIEMTEADARKLKALMAVQGIELVTHEDIDMAEEKDRSCDARVKEAMESRIDDIRTLWKLYQSGDEEGDEELGTFLEYGLSFDYVAVGTFTDQEQGYFRYQLSCGGPQEEFRFYVDPDLDVYKIEFWFLDWFDGASRTLYDDDKALLKEIYDDWKEIGIVQSELDKAIE